MIDLHCHLLPGIDDGPKTMEQSLELARLAVSNGITHSIVTPHIHPGRYKNDAASIQTSLTEFKAAIAANNIPLKLGFAGEVRLSAEVLMMVEHQQIPFYGELDGYKVFLLELPHSHVPPGSDKLVQWLLDRKLRPMIAHPERNKDIMRKFDKVQPFIELGCLFQLTAGSIAGALGESAQHSSRLMLESGKVNVIASDAHNLGARPPRLDHGRDAAAEIIGSELAANMVYGTPAKLAASQFADLAFGN